MSSKRWLIMFICTVLFAVLIFAAFNYVVDPFGAFGDRFFKWWSYDMTNNPRVAKFNYLKEHHSEYDSYIIGASGSSSFSVDSLNEKFGGSFYNLTMYGSDMQDVEQTSKYLIDNYTVKNLVVSMYIQNAEKYAEESEPLTRSMHFEADGSSAIKYYLRYLFANPKYACEKIKRYNSDGYLQTPYKVYNAKTGTYDKSVRDIEPIGDIESYLKKDEYCVFNAYPTVQGSIPYLDKCMASLTRIKEHCEKNGVTLTVLCPTMYYQFMQGYSDEDILTFRKELAKVTGYYDFTINYASFDPRFFYDATHFRNCLGDIAIQTIGKQQSDVGVYVKQGTTEFLPYMKTAPDIDYTKTVPILMYHSTQNADSFEAQIKAVYNAGYNAVTFEQLKGYVDGEITLPENPIVITFDDGYQNNIDIAYPILKKYGYCGTVFAIGQSMGKDVYKDGKAMTPHFSKEDIESVSGTISVQSHTFDLHEVEGRDQDPIRKGVLQRSDESEAEYIEILRSDFDKMTDALGYTPTVMAFPYGLHDTLAELIFAECGIYASVTIESGKNEIIKGMPQSLYCLNRFDIADNTTPESLLEMIK